MVRSTGTRSGEGRNRTGDTTVFSRVLYRLSYLAAARQCSPSAGEPWFPRVPPPSVLPQSLRREASRPAKAAFGLDAARTEFGRQDVGSGFSLTSVSTVLSRAAASRVAAPHVSVGHVADGSGEDRSDHRRRARPRPGTPRSRHGAFGDAGCGARGSPAKPGVRGARPRQRRQPRSPRRRRSRTSGPAFCPRSRRRAPASRRSSPTRRPPVRSRWFSEAITPSRSGRSQASRRRTGPAACSGSTRTPTSTRPRRARAGTSTACRSRPPWASPASSRVRRGLSRRWNRAALR